jgi:hypothetical protein
MENKSNTGLYLGALVILALLEVVFALGINFLRPSQDNTSLIVMVGTVLVPMVTSIINIINGERAKTAAQEVKKDLGVTNRTINGRMEELISAAAKAAHAEGYHLGKSEAIMMLAINPTAIATPTAEAVAEGLARATAPTTKLTEKPPPERP